MDKGWMLADRRSLRFQIGFEAFLKFVSANTADKSSFLKPGKLFLIPYNTCHHWTLTIVEPSKQSAYYMDPLRKKLDGVEWSTIIKDSLHMYKSLLKKPIGKKQNISFKHLLGTPQQKEWGMPNGQTYTTRHIDEIREEWAKHVSRFTDK